MDSLRVDMRNIERLDVVRLKRQAKAPPRRRFGSVERPIVEVAIDAAAQVSDKGKLLQELKDMAEAGGRVAVTILGGRGPMIRPPSSTSTFTLGMGAGSALFASIGVSAAAGIYGSTTREFGLYSSRGIGIWTDAGASAEMQITYVFGPPSKFGGMAWSIGASADTGVGPSIGCSLIFGTSGPPFEFLGYTIAVGAGVSVVPASVNLQVTSSQLIPV